MSGTQYGVAIQCEGKAVSDEDITWLPTLQDATEMYDDNISELTRSDSPLTHLQIVQREVGDWKPFQNKIMVRTQAVEEPVGDDVVGPEKPQKQWRYMNIREREEHIIERNRVSREENDHNPFDGACSKHLHNEPVHSLASCHRCRTPKKTVGKALSAATRAFSTALPADPEPNQPVVLTLRPPTVEAWQVTKENMPFLANRYGGTVDYNHELEPDHVRLHDHEGRRALLNPGMWVVETKTPQHRRRDEYIRTLDFLHDDEKQRLYDEA